MLREFGILVLFLTIIMMLFGNSFGVAVLMAVIFSAIFCVLDFIQEKKKKEQYEKTKFSYIEKNKQLYSQYEDDFYQSRIKGVGSNLEECEECYVTDSIVIYKTPDSRLVVADSIPPKAHKEDLSNYKIIDATAGKFQVIQSYKIDDILFWQEKGSLQYTANVSGGGVNIAGAVAGALIAGDAGAIVGSREAITTQTNAHDSREIIVKMSDASEHCYSYVYRKAFLQLIPKKEYSFIQMNNSKA